MKCTGATLRKRLLGYQRPLSDSYVRKRLQAVSAQLILKY